MSSDGLATGLLTSDELGGLAASWNELVAATALPLPFLSHPWLRLWWRHFGEGLELVIPVVRRGGTLLAACPLVLRPVRCLGARLTVGEILGTGPVPTRGMGLADKADFLVRADAPEALEPLSAQVLQLLGRADVLHVKGFDESSRTAAALTSRAPRPRSVRRLMRSSSPYLELTGSWDGYLDSRSSSFRKHLKKYRRGLEASGPLEIVRMEPEDDARSWMSEVFAVSEASWTAARGTSLFHHPRLRAFFLDLVPEMARQGWLDLRILRVGGRAQAYELCFDIGGRIFSYNGGYRRDCAKFSPGTLLTAAVIESAYATGRMEYDMLRGDEEYKSRWSTSFRSELQLFLPAPRLRSRLYAHAGLYAKERARHWRWLAELDDRISGLLSRSRDAGAGG